MIVVSESWKTAYPGAVAGILVMRNVVNPSHHALLEERKTKLEGWLRTHFSGCDVAALKALPQNQIYDDYYRRWGKSYHVQLQLESVALKGKSIPSMAALVEAMFMAELKNLLLTAGHDLASVEPPIELGVSTGHERYVRLNGQEQKLKSGDMMMADRRGVIASVIYGPDHRTRITPDTRNVFFVVYAPAGIGEARVRRHLEEIRSNVLLIAPEAEAEPPRLHVAR